MRNAYAKRKNARLLKLRKEATGVEMLIKMQIHGITIEVIRHIGETDVFESFTLHECGTPAFTLHETQTQAMDNMARYVELITL